MIDTVVFDFVNTLAYLNPKREDVIYNFLIDKGIKLNKSKVLDALKIADDQCHYSCFEIVDKDSKKNFFQTKYNKALLMALDVDYTIANCIALYDYFDNLYKEWILHDGAMETIKELKVRNFKYKTEDETNKTHIGLIAQEAEIVDSSLVNTTDGLYGLEEEQSEERYRQIYNKDLYYKMLKALQEAITKIETLEAKVAVLEG